MPVQAPILATTSDLDIFQDKAAYPKEVVGVITSLAKKVAPLLEELREELSFFGEPEKLLGVVANFQAAISLAAEDPTKFGRVPMAADVFCEHFKNKDAVFESLGLLDEDGHEEYLDRASVAKLKKIYQTLSKLRTGVVAEIGSACAKMWKSKATVDENFVKGGNHSWVVRVGDNKVVLISKEMPSKSFEKYKLRKWCSSRLTQAGLEQPKIYNIGARPAMHAFMDLAPGKSLGAFWKGDRSVFGRMALKPALAKLGCFFRDCKESIPLRGFGELEQVSSGKYQGKFSGHAEALAEDLDSILLLGARSTDYYRDTSLQTGILGQEALGALFQARENIRNLNEEAFLANGDPYPHNYLYDIDTDRISALDMDEARALTPTELAARLMVSWGEIPYGDTPIHACVEAVLETFSENLEERAELIRNGSQLAALVKLREANDLIDNRPYEDIGLEERKVLASYHFAVRSFLIQGGLVLGF